MRNPGPSNGPSPNCNITHLLAKVVHGILDLGGVTFPTDGYPRKSRQSTVMKSFVYSAALLVSATAVQAQSVIFGAGYADFSSGASDDHGIASVEYHHRPFHQATRFSATWGGALSVDTAGDTHVGAGVIGVYSLSDRWFTEVSVMPGYYNAGDDDNDLGGHFQIRSLLGVGYTLNGGNKLSLAVTHKSNASTNSDNPGVNALLLRYHYGF